VTGLALRFPGVGLYADECCGHMHPIVHCRGVMAGSSAAGP